MPTADALEILQREEYRDDFCMDDFCRQRLNHSLPSQKLFHGTSRIRDIRALYPGAWKSGIATVHIVLDNEANVSTSRSEMFSIINRASPWLIGDAWPRWMYYSESSLRPCSGGYFCTFWWINRPWHLSIQSSALNKAAIVRLQPNQCQSLRFETCSQTNSIRACSLHVNGQTKTPFSTPSNNFEWLNSRSRENVRRKLSEYLSHA